MPHHKEHQVTWIYSEPTFRASSQAEIVRDASGNFVQMRLCEELVAGRWESFYTYVPIKMTGAVQ
jgi:hypothetical protein